MNLISNKSEIQVEIIDFALEYQKKTSQNYLILSIEQYGRNYGNRFGASILLKHS
jgi:hypothetical protein